MKSMQEQTTFGRLANFMQAWPALHSRDKVFKAKSAVKMVLTAIRRERPPRTRQPVFAVGRSATLPRSLIPDLEIVTPNFSRRLSGVTATLERVLPVLAQRTRIAALGPGLSAATPRISFLDLPMLWRKPADGDCRVWHARRNIEMLAGIVLRDGLGFPLKLVFTSASQRQHTSWTRGLIRRMDAVIATSNKTAAYLRRSATVIGHGVDADAFRPARDSAEVRAELGLPGLRLVGCFGRIRPGKGSDVFVDAMLRVLASRQDVGAVLLGRATLKHAAFEAGLRRKIEAGGLSDRFLILPEVAISEMPSWYRALNIYVAPQRWEGFGVTPLEAMATGIPVVATRVGAFGDILTETTGALVDAGDVSGMTQGIFALLDDPDRAAVMGIAGRSRVVEEFSLESEARAINLVYRGLLGKRVAAD